MQDCEMKRVFGPVSEGSEVVRKNPTICKRVDTTRALRLANLALHVCLRSVGRSDLMEGI